MYNVFLPLDVLGSRTPGSLRPFTLSGGGEEEWGVLTVDEPCMRVVVVQGVQQQRVDVQVSSSIKEEGSINR